MTTGRLARVDRILIAYLLVIAAAVVVLRPARWPLFAAGHIVGAGAIVLLAHAAHRTGGPLAFLHRWYPVLSSLLLFEEVGPLVHMIHPGWYDRHLLAFDARVFGTQPALALERVASPLVTEIMQALYFSYFLILPSVGLYFYVNSKWSEFEVLMTSLTLGYTASYLLFYLFPVEGPFHTLRTAQTVELRGWAFASLMDWIERYGRVHGGAFPSAHVVGTLIPIFVVFRYARRLAWCLAPLGAGVLAATVYGRYHYFADVVGGAAVALVACACTKPRVVPRAAECSRVPAAGTARAPSLPARRIGAGDRC